jgi:Protein of unknown function C-terminus (DUF2399)
VGVHRVRDHAGGVAEPGRYDMYGLAGGQQDRGVGVAQVVQPDHRQLAGAERLAGPAAGPEPLRLTWRSPSGSFDCGAPDVHVCENPSVVIAAADQLGADALPLVCTNGRPCAAVRRLLSELAGHGATIHARADDDAAGRDIIDALRAMIPSMRLWRYPSTPAASPRYEEQDLALLLQDLRASGDTAATGSGWTSGLTPPGCGPVR